MIACFSKGKSEGEIGKRYDTLHFFRTFAELQ